MTTNAFRPTAPLGIAVLTLTSATVGSLILLGSVPAAPRLWVFLGITGVALLSLWRLSRAARLSPHLFDQAAWIILICHPVLVARVRNARILAQDQSLSAEIAIEIGIWCVLLMYAAARLLGDLSRLRSLWGNVSRYATLFLVAATSSALYAASPAITLVWSVKLLTIVSLCCVVFDPLDPEGSLRRFVTATYWGFALMLAEFLLLAAISPEAAMGKSTVTGIWRLGGFLLPATQLSSVAGIVAVMSLVDILAGNCRRWVWTVFTASSCLMLASLGRGGMLATAAAMLLALAAYRKVQLAVCLAVAAAVIMVAVPDALDASWQMLSRRQSDQEIMNLTGRVQLWQTAIELIAEKPLLGWGYVSGSRVALLNAFRWWAAPHAHNAYLEILLALGVVGGMVLFLLLRGTYVRLIVFLRHGWSPRLPDESNLGALKMLACLVLLTIEGLFTSGFSGAPLWATTLLIGSAFYANNLARHVNRAGRGS